MNDTRRNNKSEKLNDTHKNTKSEKLNDNRRNNKPYNINHNKKNNNAMKSLSKLKMLRYKKENNLLKKASERVDDINEYLGETRFNKKFVMSIENEFMLLRFLTTVFDDELKKVNLKFIVTGGYAIQTYSDHEYKTGDIDIKVYSFEINNDENYVSKLRDKVLNILQKYYQIKIVL